MELTNDQWKFIEPLLPKPKIRKDKRGRPWKDPRDVLEGILWILRTGAPWKDLPSRYPPHQTCHRRFQAWSKKGTIEKVLQALAEHLRDIGKIDLTETYIDGTFSGAKKGGLVLVKPRRERAQKSWQSQTAMVFLSPLGLKVLHHMRSLSLKKQ
jgi:transposase